MKKIIKNILRTLYMIVFLLIYCIVASFKYIFTGKRILAKIAILMGYAGIAALGIWKPLGLWIVLGIIGLLDFVLAIIMTKTIAADKTKDSENGNSEHCSEQGCKIPFFDGMTVEEAKKEYHKLMKKYHPDNSNGDEEMTKKVSAAYQKYRSGYGR